MEYSKRFPGFKLFVRRQRNAIATQTTTTPQSTDFSVIHGLRAAIEAISEPTESQKEMLQQLSGKGCITGKSSNKGRVICITSARDNASMKSLEDIFHTVLMQQNSTAASHKELLTISHCHYKPYSCQY